MIHRLICVGIVCLSSALAAFCQVAPERAPDIQVLEFRQDDLVIDRDLRAIASTGDRAADLDQRLRSVGIAGQHAKIDMRSGRWATLLPSIPLVPGDGVGNALSWPSGLKRTQLNLGNYAWDQLMQFLQLNESAFGVEVVELLQPGRVTIHRGGDLIQIYAPRVIDGIPVENSYLTATINSGNLILLSAVNWGDMDAELNHGIRLTAEDAQLLTGDYTGRDELSFWREPTLRILPLAVRSYGFADGLTYRLVYVTSPNLGGFEDNHWECLVDAISGEILAFQDTYDYFGTKEIKGGVYPITNNGNAGQGGVQMAGYPMPFTNVIHAGGNDVTDGGGNLAECFTGQITTTLEGPYLAMTDDCGSGPLSESSMTDLLELGESAGDCDTPPGATSGSNTSATRSGFYEIGKMQEMARSHLPSNTWLRNQLPSRMNIALTCNATGGSGGLRFYRSGGGCTNTGEIAGVFDHEWGHGMDGSDANPGISNPGEGIADIYASLRLNTSCIGRNFRLGSNCGGYGDPCLDCDGVRDIDFAKRTSGNPHDVAWVNSNCPSGPGPCGASVHCAGAVYAEAVWDLWNRDLQAAPYNMNVHQAREIAMRLTFLGAGMAGTWFTCNTSGEAGCDADGGYLNYLAADDDDGDIGNGTPHMQAIFAAFDRHGAACSTPTVQDSGCPGTPASAPVTSGFARDKAARLSWTAVSGAVAYRVYRTEGEFGCDFGKVQLAETDALGFTDSGLQNGREYSYQIAAIGPGDSCIGPLSDCEAVTPMAGANLAVLQTSVAVSTTTGDGDPFVDNCETTMISFDVNNIGSGALTNPRISAIESISHPSTIVNSTLPLALGASIASCAQAGTAIEVVPMGLSYNDVLVLKVTMTGDELGGENIETFIEIANTESDFAPMGTLTWDFESDMNGWQTIGGTFARSDAVGGAEGTGFALASSSLLDGQCDTVISPAVRFTSTTTLSVWTNFDIEVFSSSSWWDRANLTIVNRSQGDESVVDPDGGRLYNASGTAVTGYCTNSENGWADAMPTWAQSTFSASSLNAAAVAGDILQLEAEYGTDGASVGEGFRFDQVVLTDVDVQVPDVQVDICGACFTLNNEDWPTTDILAYIDCVNLGVFSKTTLVMAR